MSAGVAYTITCLVCLVAFTTLYEAASASPMYRRRIMGLKVEHVLLIGFYGEWASALAAMLGVVYLAAQY